MVWGITKKAEGETRYWKVKIAATFVKKSLRDFLKDLYFLQKKICKTLPPPFFE